MYNGKVLTDDMSGHDFDLSENSTLMLLSRLMSHTSPLTSANGVVDPRQRLTSTESIPTRANASGNHTGLSDSQTGDHSEAGRNEVEDDDKDVAFPMYRTKLSSPSFLYRQGSRDDRDNVNDMNQKALKNASDRNVSLRTESDISEKQSSPSVTRSHDRLRDAILEKTPGVSENWSTRLNGNSTPPSILAWSRMMNRYDRDDTDEDIDSDTDTENDYMSSPVQQAQPENAWEKDRQTMEREFEMKMLNRLEEERVRWNRAWSAEKKDILQKANRDRQELMQENSRLRREISMGYTSIDNKQLEDERDVLMNRIHKLDKEKQDLINRLTHTEKLYETERDKSDLNSREIQDQYRQETAELRERNEVLTESVRQMEEELKHLRHVQAGNVETESQIAEIRKQEKGKWEKEKHRMLKNWKEETEILTYLSQEAKESWLKEKEELLSRFERERSLYMAEEAKKADSLNQEIGALKAEMIHSKRMSEDISSEYDLLRKKLTEYMIYVESADNAISELKERIVQLSNGNSEFANSLVEVTTQKAMEMKRSEKLEYENTLLREQLAEETKKRKLLHNAIEDAKGNIRVVIRMRPLQKREVASDISGGGKVECRDESTITVTTASNGTKPFNFFRVFGDTSSQGDVFDEIRPLMQSAIDGYNVCVLAYGQTGTGKTFTIYGEPSKCLQGVLPRAIEELFSLLNKNNYVARTVENIGKPLHDMVSYAIKCSMVELHLDNIIDLLDERDNTSSAKSRLEIRQHHNGRMYVQGLTEHTVHTYEELMELLMRGNDLRQVHKTNVNDRSSRSHTIFTIALQITSNLGDGKVQVIRSKLIFVDLAGSERVSKSQSQGERFKEAQHINRSLSSLGDVISALSLKKNHVPYRNSKLTMLLQDSIGGNAKTVMFANVSPAMDCITETVSTLSFAARVKKVQNRALRNTDRK